MARIHVRGGRPLAGYTSAGMRLVVMRGDYDTQMVDHLFPQAVAPGPALEITNAHGANPLFVKCAEYVNEIEWPEFPNGGHPYSVPA
jgi:hypothetical protein